MRQSSESGGTHILISVDELSHICGRVFVKLLVITKDKDGNINGTKHGKLMSLLEEAAFSLQECAVCAS